MNNKKKAGWFSIVLFDPEAIPGKSVLSILNVLQKFLSFNYIFLSDIEGAGINTLMNDEKIPVIQTNELLEKNLSSIRQFDWGDFFLFKEFPTHWSTFEQMNYPEIISLTEATIRAVDDTYIYIYTRFQSVIDLLKEQYIVEEINEGSLVNFEYPF